jgi:hypothetical protein
MKRCYARFPASDQVAELPQFLSLSEPTEFSSEVAWTDVSISQSVNKDRTDRDSPKGLRSGRPPGHHTVIMENKWSGVEGDQ